MLLSLRPVFVGWMTLAAQLPLQRVFSFWAAIFFGGMVVWLGLSADGSKAPFVISGAVAFVGIPLAAYVGKRLNYWRTEYRFYPDRLEFEEGLFIINRKVIKLADVK